MLNKCTCDESVDDPCFVHFRENQLQDEVLRLRALLKRMFISHAEALSILMDAVDQATLQPDDTADLKLRTVR